MDSFQILLRFLLLASIVMTLDGDKDPNENHNGTI